MKKSLVILSAVIAFAIGNANAQYFNPSNNLLYHSQRTPQINMLNPAFHPNTGLYIMLPATGLQFGMPLSIGDMVTYYPEQQRSIIDVNDILHKLGENNDFRSVLDINLLGGGFRIGDLFMNANTRIVLNTNLGLPVQVVNAVLNGNVGPDGNPISEITLLDGDLFNMQAYLETSVGAGLRIKPINLTVGVHAKLLSGLLNLQTDETRVTFETGANYDEVTARVSYKIQEAAVLPIDTAGGFVQTLKNVRGHLGESIANMIDINNGNTGVAFDLGAQYNIGPFAISASIIDLTSGIHWQKNVNTLVPRGGEGTFTFTGMELGSILDGGQFNTDSIQASFTENLNNLMPTTVLDSGDYWYSIPTKINVGASFSFLKMMRVGLLFHGQFDRGLLSKKRFTQLDLNGNVTNTFRYNTTASFGINLFNWIELIVGSSLVFDGKNADFLNPGVGIILTPATMFQSYIMVDYLSSLYLTEVKALNVKFGLNILFGKR